MFLDLDELVVGDTVFPIQSKSIKNKNVEIGLCENWHYYRFVAPWMALNQKNHREWEQAGDEEKGRMLRGILTRNMLNFYKAAGTWLDGRLEPELKVERELGTHFKNVGMTAFTGQFKVKALLPDLIGLGKSTSRGYGTILMVNG